MRDKTIDDLIPDFQKYEKARGKSAGWYGRCKYAFGSFKAYLEENGADYLRLSIREAGEYQAFLSNAVYPDGSARYTASTINGYLAAVKAFYNFLLKNDSVISNPFKYIKSMRKEKGIPKNLLREKEMADFLELLFEFEDENDLVNELYRYRMHVIAELLYSAGARIGEIALLKKEDIDYERSLVKITDVKTKRERWGILNEYAREVLRIYAEEMESLFVTGRGCRHTDYLFHSGMGHLGTWFNARLKAYSGRNDFTSHHFRHSVGYHLLRAGCGLRHIQVILGHAELRSTSIYTRIDKEDLRGILDEYHPRQFGSAHRGQFGEKDPGRPDAGGQGE